MAQPTQPVQIRLDLHRLVKIEAAKSGRSISSFVNEAVCRSLGVLIDTRDTLVPTVETIERQKGQEEERKRAEEELERKREEELRRRLKVKNEAEMRIARKPLAGARLETYEKQYRKEIWSEGYFKAGE